MDIERPAPRQFERGRWQDQSVGGDDKHLRPRGRDAIKRTLVGQLLRLKYFEVAGFGQLLDGTLRWPHSAASGPVRLREHEGDLVPGVKQRGQRARCELWSTGED